ncbi:MAG: bifunctional adenosylcobinamide kinase/adenosylcobinamide-phosphate guanylyltransferase [Propionibacteriaceae bacterium]|jgi:adenosylcobinamide kinase/adenosylcobinamide-phosphate guanylyltransferase|nr:bifunctional adenosylcobinamide kinase/adenosylcobinamide-phosphate guanylyltransferase [Propionibacteriaceae bacterium]
MTKTLVTGGVRSGKSRYAEQLFSADAEIAYLAPGYLADAAADPEWAARVASHQRRRPANWQTVETLDLAHALDGTELPALIDCVGIWVTRMVDALGGWDRPEQDWRPDFDAEVERLAAAVTAHWASVVLVSNEVGWGVVPPTAAGRVFADLLGYTNQRLGGVCDRVVLMVAGRVLEL